MNHEIQTLLQLILLEKVEQKVADRLNEFFHGIKPEKQQSLMELAAMDGYDKAMRRSASRHTFLKVLGALALMHHYHNQRKMTRILKAIHQDKKVPTAAPPPHSPPPPHHAPETKISRQDFAAMLKQQGSDLTKLKLK